MQLALLVQPLALPHPSEEPIQVIDTSFLIVALLLELLANCGEHIFCIFKKYILLLDILFIEITVMWVGSVKSYTWIFKYFHWKFYS